MSPKTEVKQKKIGHAGRPNRRKFAWQWSVNLNHQTRCSKKYRLLFQAVSMMEREQTVARGRGELKEFSRLRVLSRFCRLRRGIRAGIMATEHRAEQIVEAKSQQGLGQRRMKSHGKIDFESKLEGGAPFLWDTIVGKMWLAGTEVWDKGEGN